MIEADVKVDLTALEKATDIFQRGFDVYSLKDTQDAVHGGGRLIQSEWSKYVSGATVTYSGGSFVIKKVSGQYANAVMGGLRYPMDGDVLKSGVEVNLDYAEKLEQGFDAFNEKEGLLESPKVKWTVARKNHPSQPYIDVPFEHAASGVPSSIQNEIGQKGRSLGLIRVSENLPDAPAGLRSALAPTKLGLKPYTWRAGMFTGMVRGSADYGNKNGYVAFRRVSLASDPSSWIHPGITPKPVTKAIKENIGVELSRMVSSGFQSDVLRLSQKAGFP